MEELVLWFHRENGTLDSASMGLTDIPGEGRGAIALKDIPEGHTLFMVPRSLTLSTRTSSLPSLVGAAAWRRLQLDSGWVGLILCMMWEESLGEKSKWSGYLKSLPKEFDTPMFWSAEELIELEGTTRVGPDLLHPDKIGKLEAERDYHEKLVPALQSRPDLFDASHLSAFYSLEKYHLMGSRILSRSFQVERWEGEEGQAGEGLADESRDTQDDINAMEVDGEAHEEQGQDAGEDSGDDSDAEDPSDVAMVPMADMLNARYGSENAKLFYAPTELNMVATKAINVGDQIYNTYGDLPNSDLLRRYGHVDLVSLLGVDGDSKDTAESGNPADVVEVSADLVVEVVASHLQKEVDDNALKERIDWWLEEGGDDGFILGADFVLPGSLVSFLRLLLYSVPEWEKARGRNKLPKPKIGADTPVLSIALDVLTQRLAKYPTTLKHDETLLTSQPESLSRTRRSNALIVRVGEKRILTGSIARLEREQRGNGGA